MSLKKLKKPKPTVIELETERWYIPSGKISLRKEYEEDLLQCPICDFYVLHLFSIHVLHVCNKCKERLNKFKIMK